MTGKPPNTGRWVGVAALMVLALTGCGGTKHAGPPEPPALSHALASDLAATSDAVADALAAGDSCSALTQAQQLQAQTIAAINAHRVPAALQEQLSGAVNGLVARVSCVPPPAVTEEHDRDKHKGHDKRGRKGTGD